MNWQPNLGAWPADAGIRFRVWAPDAGRVEVVLERDVSPSFDLEKQSDATFAGSSSSARAGDRYRYRVDGAGPFPDPASRFQPAGVHGPSEVIDPRAFAWSDGDWQGLAPEGLVIYELHVGTFTPDGTFAAAAAKLPLLQDLGVTAVELMPVAEFPGRRGWGYDGVDLFAPFHHYGRPDDLRALVDAAHGLGLGVILDVVYNHFGPSGNYTAQFSKRYLTERHQSPWGAGVNLDDQGSELVRAFFIENAQHWVHEYHADGLRLDATHALNDEGPRHFLAELVGTVRASAPGKSLVFIAEDHRNLRHMLLPEGESGWGLDAVWADDFHHHLRRRLAGDHDGYYADFTGATADIARTLNQGWFFTGQRSEFLREHRGTDPAGLPPGRFVICLQNHDQVGNRALGERLHHQISPEAYRAATASLLLAPQTPMLFMGQEWAATSPFLYFTDHEEELGRAITRGRRNEFRHFAAFADPELVERIPDPQAPATFEASKLQWSEREEPPHQGVWQLTQALLRLRSGEPALRAPALSARAVALTNNTLALLHQGAGGAGLLVVTHFGESETVTFTNAALGAAAGTRWAPVLTTEEPRFAGAGWEPDWLVHPDGFVVSFRRPSALVARTL